MLFVDCIKKPECLELWSRLAKSVPQSDDITIDTKLEDLPEIDTSIGLLNEN